MNSVNTVDYVVIGLYAGLMVLVGLYVMRFNRSAAEYFRGGSRVPWLVAGLSCFMLRTHPDTTIYLDSNSAALLQPATLTSTL